MRAVVLLPALVATSWSFGLHSGDSINITLAGAGAAEFHVPSGSKAFTEGILYLEFFHPFSEHVVAGVTVKGARGAPNSLLHEGWLGWQQRGFALQGGFLANRSGGCRYYRDRIYPHSLFDVYPLWETYGFGLRSYKERAGWRLEGGFTVNDRESGALHLSGAYGNEHWSARVLAGFQSYDIWEQDNLLVCGGEVVLRAGLLGVHAVGVYQRYFGYGNNTNPTMTPGWKTDSYLEFFVVPVDRLRLSGLVRYEHYRKRYTHAKLFGGAEAEWNVFPWLGFGAGFEALDDDGVYTTAPSVFLDLRPFPERAEMRVMVDRRVTGAALPTYTVGGTLWLDF